MKRSAGASFKDAADPDDASYTTFSSSHPTTNSSDLYFEDLQSRAGIILSLAAEDLQRLMKEGPPPDLHGPNTSTPAYTGPRRRSEFGDVLVPLFAGLTASWVRFVVGTRHRRRLLHRQLRTSKGQHDLDEGEEFSDGTTDDEFDRDETFHEWFANEERLAGTRRGRGMRKPGEEAYPERKIEGLEDVRTDEAGTSSGTTKSASAGMSRMDRVLSWCRELENIAGPTSGAGQDGKTAPGQQRTQHPLDAEQKRREQQSATHASKRRKIALDGAGSPIARRTAAPKSIRTPSALRPPPGPPSMPHMKEPAVSYVSLIEEIEQRLQYRREAFARDKRRMMQAHTARADPEHAAEKEKVKIKRKRDSDASLKRRTSSLSLDDAWADTRIGKRRAMADGKQSRAEKGRADATEGTVGSDTTRTLPKRVRSSEQLVERKGKRRKLL